MSAVSSLGWAEAENEDLLGDAAGVAWENKDEIVGYAGDAWNAVSSMGWAEN